MNDSIDILDRKVSLGKRAHVVKSLPLAPSGEVLDGLGKPHHHPEISSIQERTLSLPKALELHHVEFRAGIDLRVPHKHAAKNRGAGARATKHKNGGILDLAGLARENGRSHRALVPGCQPISQMPGDRARCRVGLKFVGVECGQSRIFHHPRQEGIAQFEALPPFRLMAMKGLIWINNLRIPRVRRAGAPFQQSAQKQGVLRIRIGTVASTVISHRKKLSVRFSTCHDEINNLQSCPR